MCVCEETRAKVPHFESHDKQRAKNNSQNKTNTGVRHALAAAYQPCQWASEAYAPWKRHAATALGTCGKERSRSFSSMPTLHCLSARCLVIELERSPGDWVLAPRFVVACGGPPSMGRVTRVIVSVVMYLFAVAGTFAYRS